MKDKTKALLNNWPRKYSATPDGAWLREFNWESIPVEWSTRCNPENGIMGMYTFGKIFLMDCEYVPELIWPTYIHELHHRYQRTRQPLRFFVGKLIRPLIERPADAEEKKAEKAAERITRKK